MKITFAVPHSGCSYWRCRLPAQMIEKQGLAEVRIFDSYTMLDDELADIVDWCDVLVRQSAMGIDEVVTLRKYKELGKTVVGDYDDMTFSLSPFNPAYKTLGIKEVKITNKDGAQAYLWKDGEGGFNIKANYFRYRSLQDVLNLLDKVTVTNKFLKDEYGKHANDITILPNSIDFNIYKPLPRKDTGQVRIGWTASDSHYVEIWMVKDIMRRVFKRYGNRVKFVELGNLNELKLEFNTQEMEFHNWVALSLYPIKLASLNLDMAICPLDFTDAHAASFNNAKSQLKWSEFGALRVPCVCTDAPPYDCVKDGVTGMLAKTRDDFVEKIGSLVENKSLRENIGDNAYDQNFKEFNLEKNAILWIEAYEQAREKGFDLPVLEEGMLQRI